MDLQQLRIFVEVMRQGSFAGAARRMNLVPSQVSRAVAAIETELGARLMQRTTRRVTPTDAGAAYLQRVGELLEELDAAADDLRRSAGDVTGEVRLTASVALGQHLLMPLIKELHAKYPKLRLNMQFADQVVDVIGQHVDVALRQSPAVDESLVGLRLAPLRFRVCASPGYLAEHGQPRVPADLAACDCLRIALPGFGSDWLFREAGRSAATIETVRVGGWLVASSAATLRQAALDDLGPVLLADWLLDADIAAGRLVDLFPTHEVTATSFDNSLWLLYASREYLPQRVRIVIDFLKAALQA